MGYIKDLYGSRNSDFINGFLAAMNVYSIRRNGHRYIGSPEKELKEEARLAITELGGDPSKYDEF